MAILRFRVLTLLVFITLAAIVLAALARPSIYWVLFIPILLSALCVFGIFRAVASPSERPLWAGFIAGLFGYGATVMFIRSTFCYEHSSWGGDKDVWQVMIAERLWRLMHGVQPPYGSIINGLSEREFYSFLISLHLVAAVSASLLSIIAANYLSRRLLH